MPIDAESSKAIGEEVSDEEMLAYGDSPDHSAMDVNMITFSADYKVVGQGEEEVGQFAFGPNKIVFTKPEESVNHIKPLYVCGHIDGRPVSRMLVDGGAVINVMPYSLFRRLGKTDDELVKTNMTLAGVGGDNPIESKGIASMELTIGSKTIATAFFVDEAQGNYSLILGRDWIHANLCVPSMLHQCLIQWVGDEIEVVHADTSAYVAMADAPVIWVHDNAQCLTGIDLTDYQFVSVSKDGFLPVVLKPVENRLNHIM